MARIHHKIFEAFIDKKYYVYKYSGKRNNGISQACEGGFRDNRYDKTVVQNKPQVNLLYFKSGEDK